MGSILPWLPRSHLATHKAAGAMGYGDGYRMHSEIKFWEGVQLCWEAGHSPVLPNGVDCTWANGICSSYKEGMALGEDDGVSGVGW